MDRDPEIEKGEESGMRDMRCRCGKLLCQYNGVVTASGASPAAPGRDVILIKCRYCKRFMAIRFTGPVSVEFVEEPAALGVEPRHPV